MNFSTQFTQDAKIKYPIICGAMYPCSNPELVAEVSRCGALGVVQPISLMFVYKYDLRLGIRKILSLSQGQPIAFNAIVEKSSQVYEERMKRWVDIALEEGVRFFITALGDPKWVVEKVHSVQGKVYHDVTLRKWADKAMNSNVDGFIAVNNRAGGHAGERSKEQLFEELLTLKKPIICAGGISTRSQFHEALNLGYAGVQLGTRFIASQECSAHEDYKNAIIKAKESDIVLTEKISGVPVSVIKTPYIDQIGTRASGLAKILLKNAKTKHWMRMFYTLQSIFQLKNATLKGTSYKDYFQAGKSVEGIDQIMPVQKIIEELIGTS